MRIIGPGEPGEKRDDQPEMEYGSGMNIHGASQEKRVVGAAADVLQRTACYIDKIAAIGTDK